MPGVASITNLLGMQVQFFSLLSKLNMPWPNAFRAVLYVLELANLDPRELFAEYDWPIIDFRVLFIFISNFFPLLITIIFLVMFQPLYVVVWYITTILSFVAVGAGLLMKYLEGMDVGVWFAVGGGFVLVVCIICGLTFYCIHNMDNEEEDVEKDIQSQRAELLGFKWKRMLIALICTCGFFFGGAVLTGMFFQLDFSNTESNSLRVLGYIMYGLCGVAFLHLVIHMTQSGRAKMVKVREFFSANLLMVMMVVLGISYVPAVTYCLNNFMCTTYSCPVGTKFNPFANRSSTSYEVSASTFCDPCYFEDQRCRIGGTSPQDPDVLCPAFSERRLWKAPEIKCSDEASIFFDISACFVLPAYLILIPLLYLRLISKVSTAIEEKAKLIPHGDENIEFLPPLAAYDRKVYAVEPAASSLYQPYRRQQRYYAIPLLVFRIVIVVITTVVTPYLPQDSIYILLSVHIIATGLLVWTSPFSSNVEHYLSIGCMGCNIMNCLYAVLLMYAVGVPDWLAWIVVGINFVIPAALIVYTTKFIHDSNAKTERTLKQEHKKKQKRVLEKKASLRKLAAAGGEGAVPLMHLENDDDDYDEMALQRGRSEVSQSRAAGIVVPKGKEMSMWEKKEILEHNQLLAQALNLQTSRLITKYFMIVGFILILAVGASALGYIRHQRSDFLNGSSRLQRSYEVVLGGYDTWDNFTDSCCCLVSQRPPVEFTLQERWICPQLNTIVGRGRVGVQGGDSGLPIRSLCSSVFNFSVSVVVNDTSTKAVEIIYHNLTQLEENRITRTAMDLFW